MKRTLLALSLAGALSACVPAVFVAGAAIGAWIGTDPRSAGTQKTDLDAGANVSADIIDTFKERAHVNVSAYNGRIVLTGEVPDDAARQTIAQLAAKRPGVKIVHNETVVAPPSSATDRLNDSQITARVKTAILAETGDSNAVHIRVTTERAVVYLMGAAQPALIDRAATAASKVGGVVRVVKYVEVIPASL
ncbi:BON domain-containing protein [Chitinibacteraceae bacterium HSL-7]